MSVTPISRLLNSLNNSKLQKIDNAAYQVIRNLIKNLQVVSDDGKDNAASIENIVTTITPSNTVEDLDGTNDPGISDTYSRGDHKHGLASGYEYLLTHEATLTNAQIKALPTTEFEIVPAQGANKIILPLSITLWTSFVQDYTNINPDSYLFGYNGSWHSGYVGNDSALPFNSDNNLTTFMSLGNRLTQLFVFQYPVAFFGWGNLTALFSGLSGANDYLRLKFENNGSGNLTGGDSGSFMKVRTIYTLLDIS